MSTMAQTENALNSTFSLRNPAAIFHKDRIEMMGWMTSGIAFNAVTAAALWYGLPTTVAAVEPITRNAQVLSIALLPGAVLLASVCTCMRLFDTLHALNPLAQKESQFYTINNRILTNTVEQTTIFLPALLALGYLLNGSLFHAVPVLAGTWAIGRLAFWLGYHAHVPARAIGMVMTLTTTCVAYALAAYVLLA